MPPESEPNIEITIESFMSRHSMLISNQFDVTVTNCSTNLNPGGNACHKQGDHEGEQEHIEAHCDDRIRVYVRRGRFVTLVRSVRALQERLLVDFAVFCSVPLYLSREEVPMEIPTMVPEQEGVIYHFGPLSDGL